MTDGRPGAPWWQIVTEGDLHRRRVRRAQADAVAVRRVRGRRTATQAGLFTEFALGWEFPDYFGHNWPALEDCLTDLAWVPAPGYLCVIDHAEALLEDEPPVAMAVLTDLLTRVGAYWAAPIAVGEAWDRPAKPFRTLLLAGTPGGAARIRDRLHIAGVPDPGT
jgi:Barstar (barnase inhibitor)